MEIGYAGAFLGGLAAILSPCAALVLPAFFAYAFSGRVGALLARTGLFYLGLLITLVPLGVGAGLFGSLLTTHRGTLTLVAGIILIVFGLLMLLGVKFPSFGVGQRGDPRGVAGAVLLGMTYGLAGACTGPLLGAVLTVAAVSGRAVTGALLLASFAAGMVVPLILLSLVWDKFKIADRLRPRPVQIGPINTTVWGLISGLLFVIVGVLFITTDATAGLGGILDATQQFRLESWLGQIGRAVPDVVWVAAIALALIAFFGIRWIRKPG
ncbi:MAG TPA: cytochrome c biogenesis CcdA family protein [Tessaracoccus flavescens]|uniref:Cytochrome c biogenesis CcdA family protein n=1 Tax=Tessaracoccus flavescens TaxID=399497 RepID=A0A921ENT4_9ACTN|nr:cytochrome c biogenesis CcdA family protein [Tessaracoccus flavescens]